MTSPATTTTTIEAPAPDTFEARYMATLFDKFETFLNARAAQTYANISNADGLPAEAATRAAAAEISYLHRKFQQLRLTGKL